MKSRDGFPFEIWRVQTSLANPPVSAVKCRRHEPGSGWTALVYNAGYEGCSGSAQLLHQCQSSERAVWLLGRGLQQAQQVWRECTSRTRDSASQQRALLGSQSPVPTPTSVSVVCKCDWETISLAVLHCDATVLGLMLPREDGSTFKAEMTLCYINPSLRK